MKRLVLDIKKCSECPYYNFTVMSLDWKDDKGWCKQVRKHIPNRYTKIPKWCPLQDIEKV